MKVDEYYHALDKRKEANKEKGELLASGELDSELTYFVAWAMHETQKEIDAIEKKPKIIFNNQVIAAW